MSNLLDLSYRQVEAFHAVMLSGGVSSAARMLGTTQPAVSQLITSFEKQTQLKLFCRQRGRLVPSSEAQALFSEVQRSFIGLNKVALKAISLRAHEEGEMSVGCLPSLGFSLMPTVVHLFHQEYPNIKISLQTRNSNTVKDMILSGESEIGFAADEINAIGISSSEFARFPGVVALPVGHQLAAKSILDPEDFHGQAFISLNAEDTAQQRIRALFQESGTVPRVVAETPYGIGLCAMVAAGVGIGIINPICTPDFIGHGLVVRPLSKEVIFRQLLIFPQAKPPSQIVQKFASIARHCLAKKRSQLILLGIPP